MSSERFAEVAGAFDGRPGVALPEDGDRHFGMGTLRVDRRIFAMLHDDALVLKLPASRVAELVGDGVGTSFGSANRGKPLREWVTITDPTADWEALAEEAYAFVRALREAGRAAGDGERPGTVRSRAVRCGRGDRI
ncbi:MmcQ/YjbR family DNA-binding protein [Beutenbergia cavernae]|uniref:MmcQ/YjbR family DNA-binding protein n=1 Tax=Beutenbergia cavernae TaxID=84757 RepID=UPI00019AD830|nr:MmcQ/YjbR family DNA-binding protein [Beutenbergia cavernae]